MEAIEKNYPKVTIEPNLPFAISFDQSKYHELLNYLNVSEKDIRTLNVTLKQKDTSPLRFIISGWGVYNPIRNNITFHLDRFNKVYRRECRRAEEIAERKFALPIFFYARRNPDFLKKLREYPEDEGKEYAAKVLEEGLERYLNNTLLHETKHLADRRNIGLHAGKIISYEAAFLTVNKLIERYLKHRGYDQENMGWAGKIEEFVVKLLGIKLARRLVYNYLDPLEIRARQFAKQHENDPKWKIITLEKKSKYD